MELHQITRRTSNWADEQQAKDKLHQVVSCIWLSRNHLWQNVETNSFLTLTGSGPVKITLSSMIKYFFLYTSFSWLVNAPLHAMRVTFLRCTQSKGTWLISAFLKASCID